MMQQANIAPLDLVQAVIGPGMAVYTRFERVLAPDGSPLGVREALVMINEVLDEALDGTESQLDPATRWALSWFDEHGFADGPIGRAEQLAQERNTSVGALAAAGTVIIAGDRARLRHRRETDAARIPGCAGAPTVWGVAQQLLRNLDDRSESAAAALLSRLDADTAVAVRDLAYQLFRICTRRNRNAEAAACNGLVTAWPELSRLAG